MREILGLGLMYRSSQSLALWQTFSKVSVPVVFCVCIFVCVCVCVSYYEDTRESDAKIHEREIPIYLRCRINFAKENV